MAQRPQLVGGLAGRPIGDAGFAQMPVGGAEAALDIGRRQRGESVEKPRPYLARRAVLGEVFVGDAGQADIVPGPLRHGAVSRPNLAAATAFRVPHHAILLAHFSAEAASAGRGSTENRGCALRPAPRSCPAYAHGPQTAPAAAPRPRRK